LHKISKRDKTGWARSLRGRIGKIEQKNIQDGKDRKDSDD
jgi:hypothetical protein